MSRRVLVQKAIQYCRWLAERDGIALPSGRVCVDGTEINVNGKREFRAQSVRFGTVTIAIPNWDFVP